MDKLYIYIIIKKILRKMNKNLLENLISSNNPQETIQIFEHFQKLDIKKEKIRKKFFEN